MARSLLALGLGLGLGLVLVVLATASASCVHAIISGEAAPTLMPCLPFLVGSDPKPTTPCCSGVKTVSDQDSSKKDRKALCDCFKQAAPALGIKPEKAKQLPDLCGIKVPVPIDPSIDSNIIELKAVEFTEEWNFLVAKRNIK